ncbi:glycosyltransferase family 4 protein [Lactiplantibacillus plantarum]|uniref:glycosyltransferase family 4 protein n=1 Tax=Lactiplantibacillus plantarum TaxID=1590 RepID=UPI0032E390C4
MKIGIEVSTLCHQYDGIGTYLMNVLHYLQEHPDNNQYYLYSDRALFSQLDLDSRFVMREGDGHNHILWLLTVLPKAIKVDNIDVFWQPNFLLPFKLSHVKNVITVHDMSAYSFWKYASFKTNITHKLFLKRSCQYADTILSISKDCTRKIQSNMGVSPDKIKTIYNAKKMFSSGLNVSDHVALAYLNGSGITPQSYMLFVGTLSPRKNDRIMIDAYMKYRNRGGRLKLLFAGGISGKSQKLVSRVKASAYSDEIIFTGYVSEEQKRILYYNAAFVLFPSRLEGFGFPLLEAMQAETIVITSNVTSLPEIAGDAALYLNDIDSDEELSALMLEAEHLPSDKRQAMIQNGLKRVEFFDNVDFEEKTYNVLMHQ